MQEEIIKLLKKHTKLKDVKLEVPPNPDLGDYAFPCFYLSKKLKKNPNIIAQDLADKLHPPKQIKKILSIGPYLNFYIDKQHLAESTIKDILKQKSKYGSNNIGISQRVMVEFSQANTHKAFHVGHVRGTSIGESLARIFEFLNYKVLRANFQGDTGAHVAKWLWSYLKHHKGESPPKKEIEKWIAKIYVDAVKKLADNSDLQKEVDEINYKLEHHKDKAITSLWKKSRQWSLNEFEKIYTQLNTHFDHYFFEREMEAPGKKIVEKMLSKHMAKESDKAIIMDLEKYKLGKWVLIRRDGTTLYSTKDLALAEIKFRKYKIKKSIHVVGAAQSLHFQQLFKTLELLKFPQAKDCHHLSFTEVRLPSGKMSSRTGKNVLYSDMLNEALQQTSKETKKRNPKWNKKKIEKKAIEITIAAIKFAMLSQDPNKQITFDPKKEIQFEGNTGPYIQYTYARLSSILSKARPSKFSPERLETREEQALISKLYQFPTMVEKSADEYKPSLITNYLLDLARLTNEFYHKNQILKAEKETKAARIALISATAQVIKNGLTLLGITTLKSM